MDIEENMFSYKPSQRTVFLDTINGARVATNEELSGPQAQVLLFKNGYAIVTRKIQLTPTETTMGMFEHTISHVPNNAVHGSFWVLPTDESRSNVLIHCTRTESIDVAYTAPCRTVSDLLLANIGNHVQLSVVFGHSTVTNYEGVIKSVKAPNERRVMGQPAHHLNAGGTVPPYYMTPTIEEDRVTNENGNLVVLSTNNGDMCFAFNSVVMVSQTSQSKFESENVQKTRSTYGLCVTYSILD